MSTIRCERYCPLGLGNTEDKLFLSIGLAARRFLSGNKTGIFRTPDGGLFTFESSEFFEKLFSFDVDGSHNSLLRSGALVVAIVVGMGMETGTSESLLDADADSIGERFKAGLSAVGWGPEELKSWHL